MRLLALLGLTVAASTAWAQEDGFDAHGFNMVANDGDVRDPLTVLRAGAVHQGEFWFTGVVDVSDDPLVRELAYADGRPTVVEKVVDNLVALNLSAGVAVHDRLRIDVAAPLYLASSTDGESTGAGMGDLRLGVYTPIVQTKPRLAGGLGLGIAPYLVLPTGDDSRFLGQKGLTGGFDLGLTYELAMLTFTAAVGPRFNPSVALDNQQGQDQLVAGGAVGFNPSPSFGLNVEARVAASLGESTVPGTTSPGEVLGSARYRMPAGLHAVVGGGAGITNGAGASAWRVFVGLGYGRIDLNFADRDMDGIVNERDECPDDAEMYNSYQDEDGCPDSGGRLLITTRIDGELESDVYVSIDGTEDSQQIETGLEPVAVEVPAGTYQVTAGIPGYQASETLNVVSGEYPLDMRMVAVVPGRVSIQVRDANGAVVDGVGLSIIGDGAPLDATRRLDSSGLTDYELPPGRYLVFLKSTDVGIFRKNIVLQSNDDILIEAVLRDPRAVVSGDRITVTEKIFFETGSDVIQAQSYSLLEEIATLLISEPRVKRVQVQGHTDAEGSDEMNLDLSDRRAAAVRRFLIEQGVEEDRLQSRGFGEQVAIADNSTEAGRAQNRRVEFRILEMD